jgi:hypothetical protein
MTGARSIAALLRRRAPVAPATDAGAALEVETVHYNCVCDESVSLRCSNGGCSREVAPDDTLVVTPSGSVFCSESCVVGEAR